MSAITSGYSVSRPTGVCAATGRTFAVGDAFIATLVEREDPTSTPTPTPAPGLERLDFSIDAWDAGARPQPPLLLFAFWRGVMPEHSEKKRAIVLGDAELLDLFEQLAGITDPRRVAFRYMLALILIRRRVLRLESSKPGRMLVKPRGSLVDQAIEVIDPGTSEDVLAGAIEELGQIVGMDEAAAPAAPARSGAANAQEHA
jgi:hypothetical protein